MFLMKVTFGKKLTDGFIIMPLTVRDVVEFNADLNS